MPSFNMPSLARGEGKDAVAYRVTSNALDFYEVRSADTVAYWLGEYMTYGDGLVQHGPDYPVRKHNMADALGSLAAYVLEKASDEEKDTVLNLWPRSYHIDRNQVLFLADLRPSLNKIIYYNRQECRKSHAESRRNDKRWQEVPVTADGTPSSILAMMNYQGREVLERFIYLEEIRKILSEAGKLTVGKGELALVQEAQTFFWSFDALDHALMAHELLGRAKRSLEQYRSFNKQGK